MDAQARALVAPTITETIGGRDWTFAPLTWSDYAALELEMRKGRKDALEAAVEQLEAVRVVDVELARDLLRLAWDARRTGDTITEAELDRWLSTPAGRRQRWWRQLKKHHPELSREDLDTLIAIADHEAAEQAQAAGRFAAAAIAARILAEGAGPEDADHLAAAAALLQAAARRHLDRKTATDGAQEVNALPPSDFPDGSPPDPSANEAEASGPRSPGSPASSTTPPTRSAE